MSRSSRFLMLLGVLSALFTAYAVYSVLQRRVERSEAAQTVPVVVVRSTVPARTELTRDAVDVEQFPQELVPAGAVDDPEEVVGKIAIVSFYPGQPVVTDQLIDRAQVEEKRSNASFLIPEGKVALGYSVDLVAGVAQALESGDRVDILITFEMPVDGLAFALQPEPSEQLPPGGGIQQQEEAVSQLLLQDVEILRIGPWTQPDPSQQQATEQDPDRTRAQQRDQTLITFVLDPQDALVLKYAKEQGVALDLALRRAGDHTLFETESVDMEYLRKRFRIDFPRR